MVIFHSYVSLPEGMSPPDQEILCFSGDVSMSHHCPSLVQVQVEFIAQGEALE